MSAQGEREWAERTLLAGRSLSPTGSHSS